MVPLLPSDLALASSLPPGQVARLRQAAQDFEAMALGQLLQPMFATVDMAHGMFGGGAGEAAVQPLLLDALAKDIAAHGGLGLAGPVFASLLRSQEAAKQGAAGGTR
ncbi:MAG TPA: rod-binding protein [Acetobacteraceae bacterium]|nr:rod-binding protein [Acetobacteraceae bacterium]